VSAYHGWPSMIVHDCNWNSWAVSERTGRVVYLIKCTLEDLKIRAKLMYIMEGGNHRGKIQDYDLETVFTSIAIDAYHSHTPRTLDLHDRPRQ